MKSAMINLLVLYSSRHGQTEKIAARIADIAGSLGHRVRIENMENLSVDLSICEMDAAIICASVHFGRFSHAVEEWVEAMVDRLRLMPTAFFGVSLQIISPVESDRESVRSYLRSWLDRLHWKPGLVTIFAGALRYTRYGFFTRLLVKLMARGKGLPADTSRDYEYTDWNDVRTWTETFLAPFDPALHPLDLFPPLPHPDPFEADGDPMLVGARVSDHITYDGRFTS
jgi:menaquinone-dependent protoporphyrinogen oxidase